jgi:hypothetical protein
MRQGDFFLQSGDLDMIYTIFIYAWRLDRISETLINTIGDIEFQSYEAAKSYITKVNKDLEADLWYTIKSTERI